MILAFGPQNNETIQYLIIFVFVFKWLLFENNFWQKYIYEFVYFINLIIYLPLFPLKVAKY